MNSGWLLEPLHTPGLPIDAGRARRIGVHRGLVLPLSCGALRSLRACPQWAGAHEPAGTAVRVPLADENQDWIGGGLGTAVRRWARIGLGGAPSNGEVPWPSRRTLHLPKLRERPMFLNPGKQRKGAELSRELRRLRAQCERLSLNTAHERIIHFLETEGENGVLTLAQTKKQWAAELGLSHEALYRSLAQMEKSGSIRIEGRVLRLGKPGERAMERRKRHSHAQKTSLSKIGCNKT